MAIATQKLPPRSALLVLMGIFILGNTLCALAPSYGFLMAARVVTALCHGAFFGIGAVEAASLVPENKRAQAVALMFTGLTLANVLGVPLGTALGQAAGWRTTFWAVAAIGVTAFASLFRLLPKHQHATKNPAMLGELFTLKPAVWLTLCITVIASASMFALFTYIAPLLNNITHVSARGVTYSLFLIGLGMTAGNILGGRLSDWKLNTTLIGVFIASAAVLAILAVIDSHLVPTEAALFLWAAIVFAGCSALQLRAFTIGRASPHLISTLNIGAFNAGNALGAWAGGAVISAGLGLAAIPPAAAALSLTALALTIFALLPARQLQSA
jgi:DHA1 family inner membrane transport protein